MTSTTAYQKRVSAVIKRVYIFLFFHSLHRYIEYESGFKSQEFLSNIELLSEV